MVLVFAETWNGSFKKATLEAVQYGATCAQSMGSSCVAVVMGASQENLGSLGAYGANEVIHISDASAFEASAFAGTLADLADARQAQLIVVSGTANGRSLAGALGMKSDASVITNVTAAPSSTSPLTVQRGAFSSKGVETCVSQADRSVLCIVPNSIGAHAADGSDATVSTASFSGIARTEVGDREVATGSIPLPEAERVVSGGRGLKGPENWGMVEELAQVLNAGTACSKPVSDIGWRPHSEHVGQTGIQINPQLYIAIGISGAIQHLAGVSASQTIVVINNDPEAPFFKAADYGVVGDAFEVVPKLTEALKKHFA